MNGPGLVFGNLSVLGYSVCTRCNRVKVFGHFIMSRFALVPGGNDM